MRAGIGHRRDVGLAVTVEMVDEANGQRLSQGAEAPGDRINDRVGQRAR
jgi:hypothetical protein